jgi:tetratricopeptide (TPR) repeat protein
MSEPETQSSESIAFRDRRQKSGNPMMWMMVFTVIFVVTFGMIKSSILNHWFSLIFWAPVAYLTATAVIAVFCGLPRTLRNRAIVVAEHLGLICLMFANTAGWYLWLKGTAQAALLRGCVSAMWLLSIAGIVLIIETIRRGQLRWKPWVPKTLRLCIGAMIVTIGVEGMSLYLEPRQNSEPLPKALPKSGDHAFCVAAIGGSTTVGFPYVPNWGIGQVATLQLQERFPNQNVEFSNLAETGVNLEGAVALLRNLRRQPNFLLVYSGHNEFFYDAEELWKSQNTTWGIDRFLIHSPAFRVISPILSQTTFTAEQISDDGTFMSTTWPSFVDRRRRLRYCEHLARLFTWAKANDTTVVFCIPAADEATCSPLASFCDAENADIKRRVEQLWLQTRELQAEERWKDAISACEDGLKIAPNFAAFHFLAGQSHRQLGQAAQAQSCFQMACERDQFPIRLRQSYQIAGREVAEQHGVLIVDCPKILRESSRDGFLDEESFLDGVHPNLQAGYLLGTTIAQTIINSSAPTAENANSAFESKMLSFEECIQHLNVTKETLISAYRTTATVLRRYHSFTADREQDQHRLQAADRFAAWADQLSAGDITPGEAGTESLTE